MAVTIADVMHRFSDHYIKQYPVGTDQLKLIYDIKACRTNKLGSHVTACTNCGDIKVHYNSCGNRFCPQCQGFKKEKWILERSHDLLPVKYFHVVFTLPSELRTICRLNPKLCFDWLFRCGWETIELLSKDNKHGVSARMGMIAVLHTWTQQLVYHPHIHCIIPSGGLKKDGSWKKGKNKGYYLFPKEVMAKIFRGKYLEQIVRAYKSGELNLEGPLAYLGNKNSFRILRNKLYKTNWVVDTKKPFDKPDYVLEYLGRYTHRIAIGNYRIKAMDNQNVTFSYLDRKANKTKSLTLTGHEFLQRFLQHVLPKGYCKIRHYGILSTRVKTSLLKQVFASFGMEQIQRPKYLVRDVLLITTGNDPLICTVCNEGMLVTISETPRPRGSPAAKFPIAC
jgi:hypothetical protein